MRIAAAPRRASRSFIRKLPKVDLHLHLEGSLPPATLRALAARHRRTVPPLSGFHDLQGFLKAFGAVCDLLVDEEDFALAAAAVLDRARIGRVAHVEMLFSPQVFLRRGIPLGRIVGGLLRGRQMAARRGISCLLIADGVRQWGGGWFDEVVRSLQPYAGRGLCGVGIGGDERATPARDFAKAFTRARGLGLRTTVHAGEACGPESVRETLETLRPDRIGHGVRAAEDAELLASLARRRIPLEVCPTSNVATGVASSVASHPIGQLMEAGALVTVNSDDGAFFDTHTGKELELVSRAFDLSDARVVGLTLDAAGASFLPGRAAGHLRRRVTRAAARL